MILSPEEVAGLIEAAPNLLYRTLLMLLIWPDTRIALQSRIIAWSMSPKLR